MHIFNCDESAMPLRTSCNTIVTGKSPKHPYVIASGTKTKSTVMICVNAEGHTIPPYVIFQQNNGVDDRLRIEEVADTYYNVSDLGGMTGEIF